MTSPQVSKKWRPSLAMIVFFVLSIVAFIPVAVMISFWFFGGLEVVFGPFEIGIIIVALALVAVIAYVLSRAITGPVDALIDRTQKIHRKIGANGQSAIQPLAQYGTRELATLSQTYLDLASKLVERSEYVRTLAAHVSHELKSPITSIKGAAELLLDAQAVDHKMSAQQTQQFLTQIIDDTERLNAQLSRLRQLANADGAESGGKTDISSLLPDLQTEFSQLKIHVSGELEKSACLSFEAAKIIFGHLAQNAHQHGATSFWIETKTDQNNLKIFVKDNGQGISLANQSQIFEPFFTTHRESGGTGMGLHIVRAILQANSGDIVHLPTQIGTEFCVSVPLAKSRH